MELTSNQIKAIESDDPRIVCIAGPGAGKTRVLIHRLERRIKAGGKPADIMVVTFTNAAADEIRRRLANWGDGLHYCGTIHGYMLRLIQQYGALIGFKNRIALLDEDQQQRLLSQVMADLKCKATLTAVKEQLAVGPAAFIGASGRSFSNLELIAAEYFQRLITAGLLDFDSLLKFGLVLLKRLNKEKFSLPVKFLAWDEFQDSSADDAAIFHALRVENKFVVGDPDQSIYGFRGGSPRHLFDLTNNLDWRMIVLQENFRCDEQIAHAANRLIQRNQGRVTKSTVSATGELGDIFTFSAALPPAELRGIAEDINQQPDPSQCAVLVRSNALAAQFAKGLEGFGIEVCKKEKRDRPIDWRVARSLINLFANPDNDLLTYWWIEQQRDTKFANKIKLEALSKFTSINKHYLKLPDSMAPMAVPEALARSGIGAESIALVNKALALLPPGSGLAELSFALGDEELHRKETGQGVSVITMHSAKGREWDVVYLPAFEEGIVPVGAKNVNIEEERRLVFVAFTRARHRLVISYCRQRSPVTLRS